MSDPYLGQISIFSFNFAPRGWATCDGQLLSIQQNSALFALLGTFYGGNGTTTFALPNLRGMVPVNMGQGPGLSQYSIGQVGGQESHTLTVTEMPTHTHTPHYTATANQAAPGGNLWAADPNGNITFATSGNEVMATGNNDNQNAIGSNAGGQPHENRCPFLVVTFCIALQGIFPSRN
jgi:microcystin-dependent protein